MSITSLTVTEREQFLAEPYVGVLGVERPGRAPLTIPIWYDYTPGGEVLVWTEPSMVKVGLIKAAGRFSLSVQRTNRPYRYVTAEGPVTGWEEPVPTEVATAMAARYLWPEEAREFVTSNLARPTLLIRMRPKFWSSMAEEKLGELHTTP
ncbi:pyridoxamine 5'-phosphate oxidase family protein [Fodinicola feengrottensis]|uniref:Pyridoxamine 5'-phosphate oxidase family protein n=1 Tax=Fodinicola feengrottensis TaxID=435914 RepID=A0ABN2GZR4_9ACTN|nr:pyridoxamine 5'-phosphate oxidase [Fodinicola feengrottensis]